MITTTNYFETIKKVNISTLPDVLKRGYDNIEKYTQSGADWSLYEKNDAIRRVMDTIFEKTNDFINQQTPEKIEPKVKQSVKPREANKQKVIKAKKVKVSKAKKVKPRGTEVEKTSLAVDFIKRYGNFHGKTKNEKQVLSLLAGLQKAILERRIRKTDEHAETIHHIQDELIKLYKGMNGSARIEITNVEKYKSIGNSEAQMIGVKLLKRYINLQGREGVPDKLENLKQDIKKALDKLDAKNKFYTYLKVALSNLKSTSGKLKISHHELNGLQGMGLFPFAAQVIAGKIAEKGFDALFSTSKEVNGLGCSNDEKKKPYSNPETKNEGIMSVNEAIAAKFDLIGLEGKWLEFIGEACKPTSFFIYGPGGSGKSTFTLIFANYLAQKGNKVLYGAGEQYATPVFAKMLKRLKIVDSPNFVIVKNIRVHDLNNFDIIVLDSKDSLSIELPGFLELRKKYPKQSFVVLSQSTKNGDFTGSEKWRNEVDTMIVCENGKAYTNRDKNRWGGGSGEIKIF